MKEEKLIEKIKQHVFCYIHTLSNDEVYEKLKTVHSDNHFRTILEPIGVARLLNESWTLKTAVQIANNLGILDNIILTTEQLTEQSTDLNFNSNSDGYFTFTLPIIPEINWYNPFFY